MAPACRQRPLEPQDAAFVLVPPPQAARPLDVCSVVHWSPCLAIASGTNRAGGHALGPGQQIGLGVRRREARQLDGLVDAEPAGPECLRDAGQRRQCARGIQPAPRLPVADAVAHPQPVRHVTRPVVFPKCKPIDFFNGNEQLVMRRTDECVQAIGTCDWR
jgi:hypothetical protein